MNIDLRQGDSLKILPTIGDNTIDAIVTDPPYELGIIGKAWDSTGIAYSVDLWKQCLRVLKPGGHVLAFGGTRTYHRMVIAIEDAGFEIRDQLQWLYGMGFPKGVNISKQIDAKAGAKREVISTVERSQGTKGSWVGVATGFYRSGMQQWDITAPATAEAKQWDGWSTTLKPANEPICLARKPLSEGTITANVLRWGTGAINIGACRIAGEKQNMVSVSAGDKYNLERGQGNWFPKRTLWTSDGTISTEGRWPANIILDEASATFLDRQSDSAPSRFFYCAKASPKERNIGCDDLPLQVGGGFNSTVHGDTRTGHITQQRNNHPTVKPISLMSYLIRLITPPGGVVLDPFLGSGTTGIAAKEEGCGFIGIELSAEYFAIAQKRIGIATKAPPEKTDTKPETDYFANGECDFEGA